MAGIFYKLLSIVDDDGSLYKATMNDVLFNNDATRYCPASQNHSTTQPCFQCPTRRTWNTNVLFEDEIYRQLPIHTPRGSVLISMVFRRKNLWSGQCSDGALKTAIDTMVTTYFGQQREGETDEDFFSKMFSTSSCLVPKHLLYLCNESWVDVAKVLKTMDHLCSKQKQFVRRICHRHLSHSHYAFHVSVGPSMDLVQTTIACARGNDTTRTRKKTSNIVGSGFLLFFYCSDPLFLNCHISIHIKDLRKIPSFLSVPTDFNLSLAQHFVDYWVHKDMLSQHECMRRVLKFYELDLQEKNGNQLVFSLAGKLNNALKAFQQFLHWLYYREISRDWCVCEIQEGSFCITPSPEGICQKMKLEFFDLLAVAEAFGCFELFRIVSDRLMMVAEFPHPQTRFSGQRILVPSRRVNMIDLQTEQRATLYIVQS